MMIFVIGWLGTLVYLINHTYISINKNWQKNIYYGGNALAAVCLIISSYFTDSWQAIVINAFWAIISIALFFEVNLSSIKFSKRLFYVTLIALLTVFLAGYLVLDQLNLALLGWISTFVFSGCYLLFSSQKMLPRYYLCWNAFAAIALLPQLWLDQNWPVFSLEVVWAIISIYGAARKFEKVHLIQ